MVLIMICLFGDSFTSQRLTTKTEQLIKCYKPLQKMRVRLRSFQGDTSFVVIFVLCFGVEFFCSLNIMYVFIVLVKFG